MFSSIPAAAAATTMSSSSSISTTRQFQQPQPQEQQRSKRSILNFAVYSLMACSSAILLFHSYQLQSHRFDAFINNSVLTKTAVRRVLPVDNEEQQNNQNNKNTNNDNDNNNSNSEDFNKGGFYVPSLDYRIKGISQYNTQNGMNFQAHVYCEEFEKGLKWDWWRPSQLQSSGDEKQQHQQRLLRKEEVEDQRTITSKRTGTRKRLLIGLSSGYNDNAKFLERAVWSARVYGAIWSRNNNNNDNDYDNDSDNDNDVTVVTLQGTAFSPHGCKAPSSYSSIDKIRLLFRALDVKSPQIYDQLLILDADTMMYDMNVDVTALSLPGNGNDIDNDDDDDDTDDFVVAGAPIVMENGKNDKLPWMIGSSMMLWNLQHPLTPTVALDWFNYAKSAIIRGTYLSDQKYLHKSLQKHCTNHENDNFTIVRQLSHHKFGDDTRGKIIKQYIPHTNNNNNTTDVVDVDENDKKQIVARLARMEETAKRICSRHPDACDEVGKPPRYETSS